jgi:hypothetical protein
VNDVFVPYLLSNRRKCLEEAGEAAAVVAEAAAEDAAADPMCPGIQAMSPMLVLPSCFLYVAYRHLWTFLSHMVEIKRSTHERNCFVANTLSKHHSLMQSPTLDFFPPPKQAVYTTCFSYDIKFTRRRSIHPSARR